MKAILMILSLIVPFQTWAKIGGQDLKYISSMTEHFHEGILISELAKTKSQNNELRALADKMIKRQKDNIATLSNWKFRDVYEGSPKADSIKEIGPLSRLKDKKGTQFDKAFIETMTHHHDKAIVLSKDSSSYIVNKDLKNYAEKIVSALSQEKLQLKEIDEP